MMPCAANSMLTMGKTWRQMAPATLPVAWYIVSRSEPAVEVMTAAGSRVTCRLRRSRLGRSASAPALVQLHTSAPALVQLLYVRAEERERERRTKSSTMRRTQDDEAPMRTARIMARGTLMCGCGISSTMCERASMPIKLRGGREPSAVSSSVERNGRGPERGARRGEVDAPEARLQQAEDEGYAARESRLVLERAEDVAARLVVAARAGEADDDDGRRAGERPDDGRRVDEREEAAGEQVDGEGDELRRPKRWQMGKEERRKRRGGGGGRSARRQRLLSSAASAREPSRTIKPVKMMKVWYGCSSKPGWASE